MTSENTCLILSRSSPYAGQQARGALDIALTAAAFEQHVSIVFLDDGVLQLLGTQDTDESKLKNVGKIIPALKIYEVEHVYAHQPSVSQAGLLPEHISPDAELIDDELLKTLVATAKQVLVF